MTLDSFHEGVKRFLKDLVFNFGFVYLGFNVLSLMFDISPEPLGGFCGQSIFVIGITVLNFVLIKKPAS